VRDRLLSILLFIFVSSVYFATSAGLTSSNDGSHYALLRAMVDDHRFEISNFMGFAEGNDLAIRGDRVYSDRPPGMALLGAPFYLIGRALPTPIAPIPTRHDEGNPLVVYLMILPAVAGAGAVLIGYQITRSYGLSTHASLTASLAFALASTNWKYGGVLFSHSVSALLILGGVGLALIITRAGRLRWLAALLLGLDLGLSVTVEYSNAIFVVAILAYIALSLVMYRSTMCRAPTNTPSAPEAGGRSATWWLPLLGLALGLALPVGYLAWYNTANFGGPLTTSYQFAVNYPWAASFKTTFDVPLRQGLPGMVWFGVDARGEENQGLFLLMPVTLAALPGVWLYVRKNWREAALTVGVFLIYLLLFAKHHTFSGFTCDGRYLAPFLGLWFIPLAFVVERFSEWHDRPTAKALAALLLYGLIFLSARNMMAHIAFSYNYHLEPGLLLRRSAHPQNWAYILGAIFVNLRNAPLLWLVEGIGLGVITSAWLGVTRLARVMVAARNGHSGPGDTDQTPSRHR